MSAESSGRISLSLGGAKKLPKPANGVKRSHASLQDHDDVAVDHGKAQTVSHFDKAAGGAINEAKPQREERPLVIAPQANRDWREASKRNKRQRSDKLVDAGAVMQNGHAEGDYQEKKKSEYGLIVRRRSTSEDVSTNGHTLLDEVEQNQQRAPEPNGEASVQQKTDDERAIDALLGKEQKSELILPSITEEEAFERDVKDAPEMASLADYDRVPVEQFGAALLRGMGWKEGEGIGSNRGKKTEKTKLPERRPALLGIGAKEEAAVAQEMGTWGKAAKDRKTAQTIYNPVLLRDKKTGEMFTEEELEKKKERDDRAKYEADFEREEERKERRRRDHDDSGERDSSRRERDRRRDRDDDDRHGYDKSDERHRKEDRRRKDRERDRDHRDDSHRSRRYDSDRNSGRERDRDRHRDHRR